MSRRAVIVELVGLLVSSCPEVRRKNTKMQANKVSRRQPVVSRPAPSAARADRSAVGACHAIPLLQRAARLVNPSIGSVHKRLEFLDSIADSLQLHPACLVLFDADLLNPSSQNVGRMLYSLCCLLNYPDQYDCAVFLPTNSPEEPNF